MTDLDSFAALAARDHCLCVVSVLRDDSSISSSVVNAGVLDHPLTGERVAGLVSRGDARRLGYLRARPRATLTARAGWEWASAEGPVQLIGLRILLRDIFTAAGGSHDDWDTYDAVMAREHRTAVLITPERVYSNAR